MIDDGNLMAGKRHAKRDSLFLSATLTVDGLRKPVTVRVRNLSPGGMMVDGSAGFTVGARVSTELRGIGEIEGVVAWTKPGRVGITFDADVDPRHARTQILPRPAAPTYGRQQQYSSRPGLRSGR